jgi:uncharacterized iron-regulated membrane protein
MTDTFTKPPVAQDKLNKSRPKPQPFSRKWWRDLFFVMHRYVGLVVGVFAVIIGVTGSLLVFRQDLENILNRALFYITPQGQPVSINAMIDTVTAAYPDDKLVWIDHVFTNRSFDFWLNTPDEETRRVFVNQYTGEMMGSYIGGFFDKVLELHYTLLAEETGTVIMGIAAGMLFLLCVTGLVLWPGWRKLATGFSIKWNARRQRLNFDLHKVFGVTMAVFIALTAFTGFAWNFSEQSDPILHALLGVEETEEEITSTPVEGNQPIDIKVAYASLVAEADSILPGGKMTSFGAPATATETYSVWKRMPDDVDDFYGDHVLYFDQYSGKLIKADDTAPKPNMSVGEYILESFDEVHYGTFWGWPSRVLYIFVGLSIPGLFITSLVMYGSKVFKNKPKKRSV